MEKVIPNHKITKDVGLVKVEDKGEKMVSLNELSPGDIIVFSKAFEDRKEGAIEESLVRESVKDMLIKVSKGLPSGYKLVVWETYTPKSLHEYLRKHKLTENEMAKISHMTGGAVDVSLANSEGELLKMGTDLNHGAPQNKSTFYFEEMTEKGVKLSDGNLEIRKNRRILYHAMEEAGFVNNPLAWFHWDYGNAWWASATDNEAFYGAVDV